MKPPLPPARSRSFPLDIQNYSKAAYMRNAEAAQCSVRSVLCRGCSAARVLEIRGLTSRMPATYVVSALVAALKASMSPAQ